MGVAGKIASPGWRRGYSFGLPGLGILVAGFELGRLWDDGASAKYPWWALLFASIAALVIVLVLELAVTSRAPENQKQYGWIAIVLGADGRLSTSKAQAMLWTVTLAIVIVYFAAITAFEPSGDASPFDAGEWEQYLVLLGGPFAAAVLAKVAVVTKLQAGTIQRTVTDAASPDAIKMATDAAEPGATAADRAAAQRVGVSDAKPRGADLVSNDNNEVDLVDTQYLLFNAAAFLYFLVVFVGDIFATSTGVDRFTLPVIPDVVLALTSVSAATYVGNKAAQKDPPRIAAIVPAEPAKGELVKVMGTNLVPSGLSGSDAKDATFVIVEHAVANPAAEFTAVLGLEGEPSATSATFRMPDTFAGKDVLVRLVTAASVATPPYQLKVKA